MRAPVGRLTIRCERPSGGDSASLAVGWAGESPPVVPLRCGAAWRLCGVGLVPFGSRLVVGRRLAMKGRAGSVWSLFGSRLVGRRLAMKGCVVLWRAHWSFAALRGARRGQELCVPRCVLVTLFPCWSVRVEAPAFCACPRRWRALWWRPLVLGAAMCERLDPLSPSWGGMGRLLAVGVSSAACCVASVAVGGSGCGSGGPVAVSVGAAVLPCCGAWFRCGGGGGGGCGGIGAVGAAELPAAAAPPDELAGHVLPCAGRSVARSCVFRGACR